MQASFSGADWDVVGLAQPFYWIPSYVGDQPTFYRVDFLANSSTQWSYIGKHEWHCCANKRWLSAVRCMIIAPENNSRRWSYDRLKIEFHRGLFSGEAAPTAPNTIETEGKQCPSNQSNRQSKQSYGRLKIEFHGGIFSGEAAPTAPNTIETEGKQCPSTNQSNRQSKQFNMNVDRFAYCLRSIGVGCIFPHPLKFALAPWIHLCAHVWCNLWQRNMHSMYYNPIR